MTEKKKNMLKTVLRELYSAEMSVPINKVLLEQRCPLVYLPSVAAFPLQAQG